MNVSRSLDAFQQAKKRMPGGVNSPVRAFTAVGGVPRFIDHGKGSSIVDVDGNAYLDMCGSWGALILGHAHPYVLEEVEKVIRKGTTFGAPTAYETHLAHMMVDAVPTLEQIRLVSSGTEAVMSALRLARAFTGRHKIIKFDGCYHGHVDSMLVSAGSGLATQNIASSAGVPPEFSVHTISIPFNDREALERIFASQGSEIAAVIIEPVPANMGVVLPENGFLKALRDITRKHKALLIFDEVITGFRLALGGAQAYFNIEADLCCYGKIIGGGFPVGAFAGSKAIMSLIAPVGTVYQAGTLSGNPVAVSAGIATLELLSQSNFHANLNAKSDRFVSQLRSALNSAVTVNAIGSLFTVFFSAQPVNHYADARQSDLFAFLTHYQHLLSQGIYGSPSQFEANFISAAHTDEELNRLVKAIADNVLDKHD